MLSIARMATDDAVSKSFASLAHHYDDRVQPADSGADRVHTPPSAMSQPRAVRTPIRFDVDFSADLNFAHQHPIHVHQPNYALGPASPYCAQPAPFQYSNHFRNAYDFGFVPDPSKPMASSYVTQAADPLQSYLSPITIPTTRLSSEPASAHVNGNSQSPDISSPTSTENNASGSAIQGAQPGSLGSDQPPTTHGKARTRVYVACLQCRSRKIRCDGAKPTCHNCARRSSECKYDAVPKRRGPDKKPGARQRTVKKKDGEDPVGGDKAALKKKRRKSEDAMDISGVEMTGGRSPKNLVQTMAGPSNSMRPHGVDITRPLYIAPPIPPLAELDRQSFAVPVQQPVLHPMTGQYTPTAPGAFPPYERQHSYERHNNRTFLQTVDGEEDESNRPEGQDSSYIAIGAEPSLDFNRKTWWDSLLNVYSHTREAS